ncbi:Beta-lactamase precursor [compost metagenome]
MLEKIERIELFSGLNEYVSRIKDRISASAAASYIICNDQVVNEWYSGHHQYAESSRIVDPASQFNVGSIRKTYLGFVISLAIYEGKIRSLNDPVTVYLPDLDDEALAHTTIRHLLTHTHGLQSEDKRFFPPGTDWRYNNAGVKILIKLVQSLYEKSFTEILEERVFSPCGFTEMGWRKEESGNLVWLNESYLGDKGNEANLFVSSRELAYWGYLHLNQGYFRGKQIIPRKVFELATSVISPPTLEHHLPRNGFFWFVQDRPRPMSELGDQLPVGSFQSLGITGCVCLVIPQYKAVAVRMYNQTESNPADYDYLADIKNFGNLVTQCIKGIKD